MKQFIRLFLWALIPAIVWLTRHETSYPQALGVAEVMQQSPTRFFLQAGDYVDSDIVWAKTFLRDSIRLNTSASTEEQVEQLGRYLINTLHPYMHESSSELMQMSPREQFNQIRYHQASFYCSNYVAIYGFFARVAGLAVRDIELKSSTRWHIVSETWNKENTYWMLTDLTHKQPLLEESLSLFNSTLYTQLPPYMLADYDTKATRYVHLKNNAQHLQSPSDKLKQFMFSKSSILPVLSEEKAEVWPLVLKYLVIALWFFLSYRILRGRA